MPLYNPVAPRHYWDSRYGFHIREDFLTAVAGLMQNNATGTGAGVTAWPQGTTLPSNWYGATRQLTGTTTTGTSALGVTLPIPLGLGATWFESKMRPESVSDVTDTFTLRAGYIDSNTVESTDGVFFRYTDAVNSGKWQCVTRNNSVETATDSGITVAANTDYKTRIEINAAGTSALFYINDALVGTITTNIPTGLTRFTGFGTMIQKTAGTTSRICGVDYIEIDYIFTTPRT